VEELPEKLYSQREIENARTKGQVLGWIQGGGIVVGGILLLNLIGGWIPLVLLGGAGYLGYRYFIKPGNKGSSSDDSAGV
jgi:hypothetical protein